MKKDIIQWTCDLCPIEHNATQPGPPSPYCWPEGWLLVSIECNGEYVKKHICPSCQINLDRAMKATRINPVNPT